MLDPRLKSTYLKSLKEAVLDFCGSLGLTAIYADQSGERPKTPYATIKAMGGSGSLSSTDDLRATGGNTLRVGQRETSISVVFFGQAAMDIGSAFINLLRSENGVEFFNVRGFSVRSTERLINATELLTTRFEERANLDIRFGFCEVSSEEVDSIEGIAASGSIGLHSVAASTKRAT